MDGMIEMTQGRFLPKKPRRVQAREELFRNVRRMVMQEARRSKFDTKFDARLKKPLRDEKAGERWS